MSLDIVNIYLNIWLSFFNALKFPRSSWDTGCLRTISWHSKDHGYNSSKTPVLFLWRNSIKYYSLLWNPSLTMFPKLDAHRICPMGKSLCFSVSWPLDLMSYIIHSKIQRRKERLALSEGRVHSDESLKEERTSELNKVCDRDTSPSFSWRSCNTWQSGQIQYLKICNTS